jgi:glyoxylase-like metal-dependent hydrolase (beta-lactamase superfamily II)
VVRRAVALAPGVWRIPTMVGDFVNSYAFVEADNTVTLVDVGLKLGSKRLLGGLAAIGVTPADVTRIVVTHAHSDHVGGLGKAVAATGAAVLSHEREEPYLRDGRSPRPAKGKARKLPQVTVAESFMDGALLPVAGGLRVIHTPGHTPGHVSLLHEPTGVLITGDALFNVRGINYSPGFFCTDPELSRKSADVLGDTDFDLVAFMHGAEIRSGAREAVRAFLRGKQR